MDIGGQLHPALDFTDRWWGGVVISTALNAFFIFLKILLRAGRAELPAQNAMDALSYLVAAARNFAIWARFRARAPSGCELLRLERSGCFEFTLELVLLATLGLALQSLAFDRLERNGGYGWVPTFMFCEHVSVFLLVPALEHGDPRAPLARGCCGVLAVSMLLYWVADVVMYAIYLSASRANPVFEFKGGARHDVSAAEDFANLRIAALFLLVAFRFKAASFFRFKWANPKLLYCGYLYCGCLYCGCGGA